MVNQKQVTVIRHVAFENLGNLQEVLNEFSYQIHYFDAGITDLSKIDLKNTDLLVVLGGPIGVYDQNDYPFLADEITLIREAVKLNVPIVGICLGAQLIAHVLGSNVYFGGTKEIGWSKLNLATDDHWLFSAIQDTNVLHWHGDTFDLPADCELLASSEIYPNQAFMLGKNVLGLQFHLEAKPDAIEQWFIGHACEIANTPHLTVPKLRAEANLYMDALQIKAQEFWRRWLKSIEK